MSEQTKKSKRSEVSSDKVRKPKKGVDKNTIDNIDDLPLMQFGDRKDFRKVMTALFAAVSANSNTQNIMSMIAESITTSFDNHRGILSNYVEKVPVNLRVSYSKSQGLIPSVNEVSFLNPGDSGSSNIINAKFFAESIADSNDENKDLGENYKDYEFVEYKYQVSNLVTYYMSRFPEILDLFQVFSDICLNKSDIGVSIEFSDKFIKKFFLDEFKRKLEEAKRKAQEEEQKRLEELAQQTSEMQPEVEETPSDDTSMETEPIENKESSDLGIAGAGLFEEAPPTEGSDDGKSLTMESDKLVMTPTFSQLDEMNDDSSIKESSYRVDSVLLDPNRTEVELYEEIYSSVVNQYRDLVSIIEKKIRGIITSKTVKKAKYATVVADTYGYSIVTTDKKTGSINVYNPTEIRIYKKKDSEFNIDEFIFARVEDDNKLTVLNDKYDCKLFSLDAMIMMPVPNIVRISWYLYLLDLVEVLIIFNDLLKSKTIHLLQIPVFDNMSKEMDDEGDDVNTITDSLSLMNMIINNIESKLVLDSDYIKSGQSSEDVAMKLLKNVGLSIAYVPKLTENTRIDNLRLDTPNQEYDTLRGLLLEKIFAVLKLPLWIRTNADIMSNFKTIAREVVQFGHLVFMSRVNGCIAELEELLQSVVISHLDTIEIKHPGTGKAIKPEFEQINITLQNLLEDFLFDRQVTEQIRQTKISNVLSLFSTGLEMNPKWIAEYVFPEYSIGDIILPTETDLDTKRQEIDSEVQRSGDMFGGETGGQDMFQSLFGNTTETPQTNTTPTENTDVVTEATQASQSTKTKSESKHILSKKLMVDTMSKVFSKSRLKKIIDGADFSGVDNKINFKLKLKSLN